MENDAIEQDRSARNTGPVQTPTEAAMPHGRAPILVSTAPKPIRGKASFGSVYDRPDPTEYFASLRPLDYRIPEIAAPIFRRALTALRRLHGIERPTVLDICCGYGVNTMLLNYRLTMDALYRRFTRRRLARPVDARLPADRDWFARYRRTRNDGPDGDAVRVTGIDVAPHALDYARAVGLLSDTAAANLEADSPNARTKAMIARADLVTVTGGMSYIGEKTFGRLLGAFDRTARQPWIAIFPLRHMDVRPLVALMREHGLRLEPWRARAFPHRKWLDRAEKERLRAAVDDIIARGIDPVAGRAPAKDGLESVFWLARPEADQDAIPLDAIVEGEGIGLGRDRIAHIDMR